METASKTKHNWSRIILKGFIIFLVLFTLLIIFSPKAFIQSIYEFEQHHFFIFGFIMVFLFLVLLRLLFVLKEKDNVIDRLKRVKRIRK